MEREKLTKRLKQHYFVEFINIFLLPLLFCVNCFTLNQAIGFNSITAMILNGIILLEGSYFWFYIYKQVVNRNTNNSRSTIALFSILKVVNLGLFVLAAIMIMNHPFIGTLDKIGTFAFFILAILEHINYFEFQLMYDSESDKTYLRTFKRLKKSKLKILLLRKKQ